MPTTARGIWTPSDTDAVDFTTDLATMAGTIDNALGLYGNALRGTASQRAAFLSTAVNGMLWQDTDGIRMIWRKDGAIWVPAVWRWRGTTAQMNSFGANAPDGFEWHNTTDNIEYVRAGGAWVGKHPFAYFTLSTGKANSNAWSPMYGTNASWNRDSASSPGITWDTQGIKVSEDGLYEISASLYVGVANITMLFGAKLNNFEANATNLFVATNTRIMDYGTTTGLSFTRVRRLSAGDKITPTVWTNGTAGPYGLANYGTSVFLRKVSP